MREEDLVLGDGRTLHFYDLAPSGEQELAVFWHHGTPNIGRPPEPLFALADELGIRLIGYYRPAYGGSSERSGRDVASAAFDVERIADRLGVKRFAVMGHSGGGPHALACAALLPERVVGAVSIAGLAPPDAQGLDWFKGMGAYGAAALRAAAQGRAARHTMRRSGSNSTPRCSRPRIGRRWRGRGRGSTAWWDRRWPRGSTA